MAGEVKVSVRLPSDDFIDLDAVPDAPVSDVLAALVRHKIGLKESSLTLLHRKKVMDPHRALSFYNEDNSRSVTLEAIINSLDEPHLRYDDFIESVQLSTTNQSLTKVSVDAYFTIRFQVNATGLAIFLPALEDSSCIHCLINDLEANRMVTLLGAEEAARRGFRQWAQKQDKGTLHRRVHLLEITDPTLEFDASNCRYDSASPLNAGYSLGDGASWQRYTSSLPRACMLHVDALEFVVRVMPQEPLEHDTCYALLLQNGVPCPPDIELDGPLLGFSHCAGLQEDKLIFFTTEKGAANYGMY